MVNPSSWPRALLLDFYGTVVEEDDVQIGQICNRIAEASALAVTPTEVGSTWGRVFGRMCAESFHSTFRPQKELERLSLRVVLQQFECDLDPGPLSQGLYDYWSHPALFPESKEVLARCGVPICLVSNIDNAELQSALRHNSLDFDLIVTSEDCRAYKPRREMFDRALSLLSMSREEVIHVGDSLGSDVRGAKRVGIPVLWVNRKKRRAPGGADAPDYISTDLRGLLDILQRKAFPPFTTGNTISPFQ
jgi:2-haloacid dehalogenase/putative hydrolase of the HAD superfamily